MKQIKIPDVAEGQINLGLINYNDGSLASWIVLAGCAEDTMNRDQALLAAQELGADLPTIAEMTLIRELARDKLKDCFYWCKEQSDQYSAMTLFVKNGNQIAQHPSMKHRVVFVVRKNAEIS